MSAVFCELSSGCRCKLYSMADMEDQKVEGCDVGWKPGNWPLGGDRVWRKQLEGVRVEIDSSKWTGASARRPPHTVNGDYQL